MSDITYEFMQPADMVAQINNRIASAERVHFDAKINLELEEANMVNGAVTDEQHQARINSYEGSCEQAARQIEALKMLRGDITVPNPSDPVA